MGAKMFTLHNTDIPNLKQWADGGTSHQQRLRNLETYYKGMHWHSGPHWFVAPEGIWEFCNPLQDGVHCSCANHVAFGCEMVGDYATEEFSSGDGAKVRDNAVHVMATVFNKFGWKPDPLVLWEKGLAFHHDCARDHHLCPGKNVDRADVVKRVLVEMARQKMPSPKPSPTPAKPAPSSVPVA